MFVFSFVPESPRWLLVNNKQKEAMKIVRSIARGNGRPLPKNIVAHSEVYVSIDNTARSSSVQVNACSNLSQLPFLLMYVRK